MWKEINSNYSVNWFLTVKNFVINGTQIQFRQLVSSEFVLTVKKYTKISS